MLGLLKQILARVAIYSFASFLFTFATKAKVDYYISISSSGDTIGHFLESIPNGRLFFFVWGITFLVAAIPGSLYEIYHRRKNIDKLITK